MKKILIFIVCLMLCGCYNYNELEDLDIVSSIVVDYKNEEYFIKLEVVDEDKTKVYDGHGKSLSDAFESITLVSPNEIFLSHLNTVMFTKDVDLLKLTNYFLREPKVNTTFYFILTEISDVYSDTNLGEDIYKILDNHHVYNFFHLARIINSDTKDIIIPYLNEDKKIEKLYNMSLYLLACCMGNTKFPPGLFGNFVTDDFFPWAGDYHMNYNYEAPYYCIFSSNHPELFNGYMEPLHDMSENAKKFAGFFGCKGYALPVSFGPKALDVFSMKECKEHGVLFLGQKSHAAYAALIPIMHWFATYDKEYAKENYYDFIFNVALFWEDYLVKKNGKYVIKKDAAHEIPYYRGEKFNSLTHIGQINTINAINSLGLVKLLFKGVYNMAKELGLNSEKYALWEDINENLSEFPTFIMKGKKCFRYSKFGIRWRDDNTVGLQHIYPASQIGFNSGEKLLKIARNTYFINDRRLDDNGSNSYLPAGARIGVDPDFLIEGIHQNIKEFALPNKLFRHHGGGIEHLTTVPATINEMLMQSYEGVIRLFPCWKKSSDASFENLRADGAFLVSAELKDGNVTSLKIKSLMGRKCTVQCDGIKSVINKADNKEIPYKRNGNTVSFETQKDAEYILI